MRSIHIIIQNEPPFYWQALASAFEDETDFSVRLTATRDMRNAIAEFQPQVLILDIASNLKNNGRIAEDLYGSYTAENPNLVILGLNRESADYLVRMPANLHYEAIVELIRVAASGEEGTDDQNRMLVVTPSHLAVLDGAGRGSGTQPESDDSSPQLEDRMRTALRWVDVCLHQALAPVVKGNKQTSTPGWTLGAHEARELLAAEFSQLSEPELAEARARIESELFADWDNNGGPGDNTRSRFAEVCAVFKLSLLEAQILLMVLAPELDSRYGRVFGYLNDNLSRYRTNASLLARLLLTPEANAWDVRKHLTASRRLGQLQLVTNDTHELPGADAGLRPAQDIVAFLLADDPHPEYGDHIVLLDPSEASEIRCVSTADLRNRLGTWLSLEDTEQYVVQLVGNSATHEWFTSCVLESGRKIVSLDISVFERDNIEGIQHACLAAARIATLHSALLSLSACDTLGDRLRDWFDRIFVSRLCLGVPRLVLHGTNNWLLTTSRSLKCIERSAPSPNERAIIWQDRASLLGISLPSNTARTMGSISRFAEPEIDATLRRCTPGELDEDLLKRVARSVARSAVPSTVQQVDTLFDWCDIVLPDNVLANLHTIPGHINNSALILDNWGYRHRMPYGHAVTALFAGPSGTGKTMAAQIIANDLGVELFQVDLAKIVSKYIGETEKNLGEVFDAAEKASAVLLFDEADALFGKRTEVRDAHDRYANVEVAYLLQRMESYEGLAVLTTNMRQNLDPAFMRRLRFVIEFPKPGPIDREAIWHSVFPPQAPLASDINFGFLARRIELTGGNIQQIAIRAGFAAAEDGGRIEMRHIKAATREELLKHGMQNAEKKLADKAA